MQVGPGLQETMFQGSEIGTGKQWETGIFVSLVCVWESEHDCLHETDPGHASHLLHHSVAYPEGVERADYIDRDPIYRANNLWQSKTELLPFNTRYIVLENRNNIKRILVLPVDLRGLLKSEFPHKDVHISFQTSKLWLAVS